MTPEELDRRLAALPVNPNPPSLPPPRHQERPSALSACGAATLQLMQGLPRPAPAIPIGPTESERAAERAARRASVDQERAAIWPRIRNARLTTQLRAKDTPCGLILGPTGVGKTSAALWVQVRYPGLWVSARDLGAAERRHPLGEDLPPLVKSAISERTLYLDDLGTEDNRDIGLVQYVIDQRYARCLPLFVTSGLTRSELISHLGDPYVRRLVEQYAKRPNGEALPVLFVDCHETRP